MAGRDSVDEMEQMMLQMEQMKELIVALKREWQEELCCEKQKYFLCILSGILATLRQFVKLKRPLT